MGHVNPSALAARVIVDELVRCGVREAVLCPGSRSAPLAYALAAADADQDVALRLHVRTDERTAAFLALGLAASTGRVVPVVTTSGTAVVNLHPAMLEAHHQRVPVLALTADRPPELRGTGANQTTTQPGLFRDVRLAVDLGTPSESAIGASSGGSAAPPGTGTGGAAAGAAGATGAAAAVGEAAGWRTVADRCVAAATGALGGDAGPVHLNVPLRDPLTPEVGSGAEIPPGRPGGEPWTTVPRAESAASLLRAAAGPRVASGPRGGVSPRAGERGHPSGPTGDGTLVARLPDGPERTLVLLGDLGEPALARAVQAGAVGRGWPVVAEPFGRFGGDTAVPCGVRLLQDEEFLAAHTPDMVLVVGRLTLHRATGALLRRPGVRVELVTPATTWPDPGHRVERVHRLELVETGSACCGEARGVAPGREAHDTTCRGRAQGSAPAGESQWTAAWHEAGERAVPATLTGTDTGVGVRGRPGGALTTASAAAVVAESTQGLLLLGSSRAPRSLDLTVGCPGPGVAGIVGNRGLAGIDGCLSTAAGWALTHGPTTALVGDLTFLHDVNALAIGPGEPRPDLTVVVLSDDGGAIFSDLEYGRSPWLDASGDEVFRRVFTTPTGVDVQAVAAGFGVPATTVTTPEGLRAALGEAPHGLRVVEAMLEP
ncbi:2-succinyl-5-enolpyruvyl-6-hydroxy-3-cyclohexene-1-carboxylate synthase [Kytococcus sp. Marseille-QA3725]